MKEQDEDGSGDDSRTYTCNANGKRDDKPGEEFHDRSPVYPVVDGDSAE
jgi:hypothetical protein